MLLEAGHMAQNIELVAASLGISAVSQGAFNAEYLEKKLQLDKDCQVIYSLVGGVK